MEEKVLIKFRNIVKEFDGTIVLKGINLDIYENEFVTLLGPSMAGKLRTGTQQIVGRYFAGTRRNDHPPAPDCSSACGSGSCHSDTGPPCSRLLHCRYQAAGNRPERGYP